MRGFVLDLPDGVDEEDVIAKLAEHKYVEKVVPDTWVGIAGAAGKHGCDHQKTEHQMWKAVVAGDICSCYQGLHDIYLHQV